MNCELLNNKEQANFVQKMILYGLTQEECELIAIRLNRIPRKILNLANPESCHLGIPLISHF